jgi:Domain of unknown function (DUF4504)
MQSLTRHVVLIDVSGVQPEIVDGSVDVCRLSSAVKAALESESRTVEESGPALMGLLLGYPIIYRLHPDAGQNCLGSVPLIVFKVQGEHCKTSREHFVTSFSVPVDILGNDIIRVCKQQEWKYLIRLMIVSLQGKVREWFRVNFVQVEQCIFRKLKMKEERVSLPHVAL